MWMREILEIIFYLEVILNIKITKADNLNQFGTGVFKNNNIGRDYKLIENNTHQLFGFGFWSKYNPEYGDDSAFNQHFLLGQYYQQKQILFAAQMEDITLISFVEFDGSLVEIRHNFALIYNEKRQRINFLIEMYEYDVKWIFTSVVFDLLSKKIFIQLIDKQQQKLDFPFFVNELYVTLGGITQLQQLKLVENIQFDKSLFNPLYNCLFSSLIINLKIYVSENYFEQIYHKSTLPFLNLQENCVYIIQDIHKQNQFSGKIPSILVNQIGDWYALTGWVRHNLLYQYDEATIQFIQIFSHLLNPQEDIFIMNYLINKKEKTLNNITIYCDFQKFSLQNEYLSKRFTKVFHQNTGDNIFQAVQEWHFIKYQYSKNSNGILELYFSDSLGVLKADFGDNEYKSLTNEIFSLNIGESTRQQYKFYGYLYQISFFHNAAAGLYDLDNKGCFFKCNDCDGPFENNCLSCKIQQNRILFPDNKECICQQGYYESIDQECLLISEIYSKLIITEIEFESEYECDFGFYLKPVRENKFKCFQCPIREKIQFYCLECILNPLTWYLRPYCEYYLQSRQKFYDDSFQIYHHEQQIYFIDKMYNLIFSPFINQICEEDPQCSSRIIHLEQKFYVSVINSYKFFTQDNLLIGNFLLLCSNLQKLIENCADYYNFQQTFNDEIINCDIVIDLYDIICFQQQEYINSLNYEKTCGQFCLECLQGLCLRCVQDYEYFISLNGNNCLKNNIAHCRYASQIFKVEQNTKSNVAEYCFLTSNPLFNVICNRCENNYVYILSIQECLQMKDQNCLAAIASSIIHNEQNSTEHFIAFKNESSIYTTKQWCLEFNSQFQNNNNTFYDHNQNSKLFYYGCQQKLQHCEICLQINKTIWVCLRCQIKFKNKDCFENIQYSFENYLDWSIFIDFNQVNKVSHLKIYVDESLSNINKVLKSFQFLSKKYDRNSQVACHYTCLECTNNTICLRCENNEFGRPQTVSKSLIECIDCPVNCSLCYPRTNEQIFQINPFFRNQNFMKFTLQCLPIIQNFEKNSQLFYDQYLRRYIECKNAKSCKKELNINLNLFCSKFDFEQQLNQLKGKERQLFLMKNILFEDLLQNSFSQFEQKEFYQMANEKSIRIISIKISMENQQICAAYNQGSIANQFRENIFSVNLEIKCSLETTFLISKTLKFLGFSSIIIQNLKLQIMEEQQLQIYFIGTLMLEKVFLHNLSVICDKNLQNTILFNFKNIDELTIETFQLIANNVFNSTILNIEPNQEIQTISLCKINISNLTFENSKFLVIYSTLKLNVILYESQINRCKFFNSVFLENNYKNESSQDIKNLTIDQVKNIIFKNFSAQFMQIYFLQEFKNISIFINLQHFNKIEIYNFNFAQTVISNCTLFNLNNQETIIKYFFQTQCTLQDSTIFLNLGKTETQSQFLFSTIEFSENSYSGYLRFVTIINHNNVQKSQVEFVKLKISENYSQNKIQDLQLLLNQTLIYISFDNVSFMHTYISRGFGLPEISLVKIENLSIKYTQILKNQNQKFRYLHQKVDCIKQNEKDEKVVFNIYAANSIQIEQMNISGIVAINSPIIYIRSQNMQFQSKDNIIVFDKIIANENLFLVTNPLIETGIIKIQTTYLGHIFITECNFTKNILQGFGYDFESIDQAINLNIDAAFQSVQVQNSFFESNIALNSKFSINYIKSQSIDIKNCFFKKNNLLNYEVLQSFIFSGFEDSENVLFEDIQNIFEVESQSGNGVFQFQNLLMQNISVFESRTNLAVGFKFISENESNIQIYNIYFEMLEIRLRENNFYFDGVMFFDSSTTLSFSLFIQNITAKSFFLYNYCSLLYIVSNANPVNIEIYNINASNISSFSASLINANLQNQSTYKQSIKISNVEYSINYEDWNAYLERYLVQRMFNNQAFQISTEITSQRTVFLIQFGTDIDIQNILLFGLLFESAFYFNEISHLNVSNLVILNSIIDKSIIYINEMLRSEQLSNQKNIKVSFNNILLQNISTSQIKQINCFGYQRRIQNMICLKNLSMPLHLQSIKLSVFEKCNFINQSLMILPSLIQLLSIQDEHQVHLKDIKIEKINCTNCLKGLFYIQFTHSQPNEKLRLNNFLVLKSLCGLLSCFSLEKIYFQNGQENNVNNLQTEISIQNYICQLNIAGNGTCLNINNLKFIIQNSIFMLNKAEFAGGAIYSQNNSNTILIEKSYISQNEAIFGGGIYLNNQISLEYLKLFTFIENNKAFSEGKDISSSSTKLSFQYGYFENMCFISRLQNESFIIDQVTLLKKATIFGFESEYLLFPNGQKANQFKIFDQKNKQYIKLNLNFRIIALSNNQEKQINLQDSSCIIKSGINYDSKLYYTNNFTSYNITYFNNITQDYNLDDLEIKFPLYLESKTLFLEFQCNSISVPQFNQKYPFNYLSHHNNYSIRFDLRAFPCQIGEIQNLDSGTCDLCDSDSGFFVLKINQHQCLIRDDISTIQVIPVQLQLRSGFWRPYFDTSFISMCYNLQSNCLGGWIEGDTSCLLGHIGALCEQCDIDNSRGDGRFFQTSLYHCSNCENQITHQLLFYQQFLVISNVRQQLILIKMKILGFRIIFQHNHKAILFKLITNHLQILGVIDTSQIYFNSEQLKEFLNFTTTPTQTLTFKLDCLLSDSFKLSIHYIRILFILLQPLFYIIFIFLFYILGQALGQVQFNILFFSTTLIYVYIYFLPDLVGKLVQLVSYREISNFKWILANVAFRYDKQNHFHWMIYFLIPMLILIAILIPLYFFYGLHTNQNQLDKKSVRLKWGYLYCEYNKQNYKWEILRIFQKVVLLGLINYYKNYPLSQVIIIILTLFLYLKLALYFKPYSSQKLNNIDYQSMNTCLITICCVLLGESWQKLLILQYFQAITFLTLNMRIMKIIFQELIHLYLQEGSLIFKKKINQLKEFIKKYFPFIQKFKFINKILQNQELKEKRIQDLFKKLKHHLLKQGQIRLKKVKQESKEDPKIISKQKLFRGLQLRS